MMNTRSLVVFPLVLLSACATQKDMNYVQGEVSELKKQSQLIRQQSAGSYSEITQYREEIASVRGEVNELRHDYQGSTNRLDMEDSLLVSKTNDLVNRIARIEQFLALESSGAGRTPLSIVKGPDSLSVASNRPEVAKSSNATTQKGTALKPLQPGSASADALLDQGLVKMKKQDYAGAREDFQAFMKQQPKSAKVADAQFYVAETYFSEKWYEKAILEYQVVIARYTKTPKMPAAKYKQGVAFEKIGDKPNAQARYKEVVKLYPSAPEAKLAKKSLGIK